MRGGDASPVFIGGTNGSGTRVFAQALERAGVFQGRDKNAAFEPSEIIQYTRPLVPRLLEATGSPSYDVDRLPRDLRQMMEAWISDFGARVRAEQPGTFPRWGWKHPRNLFLAPLLHSVFPECYFVQVVRDGRDMAFAEKIGDVGLFHDRFFASGVTDPVPSDCTFFWSAVNASVADWAEKHLGGRFISSRLEDLCARPVEEFRRITQALGIDLSPAVLQDCVAFVHRPKSLGRWRAAPDDVQEKLCAAGFAGLSRFGYVKD